MINKLLSITGSQMYKADISLFNSTITTVWQRRKTSTSETNSRMLGRCGDAGLGRSGALGSGIAFSWAGVVVGWRLIIFADSKPVLNLLDARPYRLEHRSLAPVNRHRGINGRFPFFGQVTLRIAGRSLGDGGSFAKRIMRLFDERRSGGCPWTPPSSSGRPRIHKLPADDRQNSLAPPQCAAGSLPAVLISFIGRRTAEEDEK